MKKIQKECSELFFEHSIIYPYLDCHELCWDISIRVMQV